ncbi:MAG: tRNA uridine-5-carboxymethylaminomethyl(34) synthesis GTPase MnmE [Burkholderiales bacterium]|nr:tRNA uridine-5-carboxymethylaminomethyl(34) synthesis GTPase MnmE [Burkholderiales bacterium]
MLNDRLAPIVAIATAPGRGAVGIVRVSGTGLRPLAERLCGRHLTARLASYGPFLDASGHPIDQGLALFFPAPHSYTGEDVLELQAHGGPVVMQLLLARCLAAAAESPHRVGAAEPGPAAAGPLLAHLRVAEPGEFTLRAFLNNKLDLAQAEAVADLIDASTETAARSAARSLGGAFSREITTLRDALIELRALVEATLDFPEEEIDFLRQADAQGRLARLNAQLDQVSARARQGALLREGLHVVIAGQPNAGKSSLLNALAGAELAIVTPLPGTTRDRISQTIQIEGVPLHIVDTAGLRDDSSDAIERLGIERSWQAIADADVVLLLHDLTRLEQPDYLAADAAIAARLPANLPRLHVYNKVDACDGTDVDALVASHVHRQHERHVDHRVDHRGAESAVLISARSGTGLQTLRQALLGVAGWQALPEGVFIARERHVDALRRAGQHLQLASEQITAAAPALELLAEELRLTHDALGDITGAYSPDDLLGDIFGRFCIGK